MYLTNEIKCKIFNLTKHLTINLGLIFIIILFHNNYFRNIFKADDYKIITFYHEKIVSFPDVEDEFSVNYIIF